MNAHLLLISWFSCLLMTVAMEKYMRNSQTDMTVLVTPQMSNFGGKLLKLLDHVAYTCAMRYGV